VNALSCRRACGCSNRSRVRRTVTFVAGEWASAEAELSSLLDREWDPIGVYAGTEADRPPPGEYASYVRPLLHSMRRRDSAEAVAAYLRNVTTVEMGIRSLGQEIDLAERLLAWYAAQQSDT
jgi:hypothetical protein